MAYLGVDVTFHPPKELRKSAIKKKFKILGIAAGVLVAVQGIRIAVSQREILVAIKTGPPGFMHISGNPFFVDGKLVANVPTRINLGVTAGGSSPIYNVQTLFSTMLSPTGDNQGELDRAAYLNFENALQKQLQQWEKSGDTGTTATPGYTVWSTTVGTFTQDQVDGILNGRVRLYTFSWARWKDAPKDFEDCVWLQRPESADLSKPLIWHICEH
jgi:hypothetical protein